MIKKLFLPVAILLVVNYVAKKYLLFQKVFFKIKKVNFNNNILNPKLSFVLTAINPTNASAKITNLVCDIFFNNRKIGVATNDFGIVVNKNSSDDFVLNVSILPLTTILSVLEIFKNYGGEIKITGSADVDGIKLPIDVNYQI